MSRKKFEKAGRRAELLAAIYLQLKGYRILERRFKTQGGEIDLIAKKGGVLVIVEVKQRLTREGAEDSLTSHLIRRVSDAAETYYARTSSVQSLAIRFDAVFVIGKWKMAHLKDAWRG